MRNELKIIPCPKSLRNETLPALSEDEILSCQKGLSCQSCYQLGDTILLYPLPKIPFPAFFLILRQFLKNLENFWLFSQPLFTLAAILSLSNLASLFPSSLSWFFIFFSLYWLYWLFNKRTPKKSTAPFIDTQTSKEVLDISQTFTENAHEALVLTLALAELDKKHQAGIYHLLQVLLDFPQIKQVHARLALDPQYIASSLKTYLKNMPPEEYVSEISYPLRTVFYLALQESLFLHENYIDVDDLFLAAFRVPGQHLKILSDASLTISDLEQASLWTSQVLSVPNPWRFWENPQKFSGGINRDWTGTITPLLDKFSLDLTKLAQKGKIPEVVDWKEEIEQIEQILERQTENNIILVGPPGCGKSAIVQKIAQRIIDGNSTPALASKRLVLLTPAALIAGAENQGQVEDRLKTIIDELTISENVILCFENIEDLFNTSVDSPISALPLLQSALKNNRIRCLGMTTPPHLHQFLQSSPDFLNCFQIVEINQPTEEEALEILFSCSRRLEKTHHLIISYPAVKTALAFAVRYIHDRVLPDSAFSILDETAARLAKTGKRSVVSPEDVAQTVSQKTKIPLTKVTEKEKEKLLKLEEEIHQKMIGQEKAVKAVSEALRRNRTNIRQEKRPIASFLFLGPTGVGKTQLAKTLAEVYYGKDSQMIRLDMSEYQEKESINRLIGAPPGKSEFTLGGQLTESLRKNPFSLVLLDEFEKAHPEILNLFLQVLEDGRLTDSAGNLVDFTDAIIIATSNALSEEIQENLRSGKNLEEVKGDLFIKLQKIFKPELLNRFDDIIFFKNLTEEEIKKVALLHLASLNTRLKSQNISLQFTPEVLEYLTREGYSQTFGARPLRRLITEKIENALSRKILEGQIKKGDEIKFDLPDLAG